MNDKIRPDIVVPYKNDSPLYIESNETPDYYEFRFRVGKNYGPTRIHALLEVAKDLLSKAHLL